MKRIIAAVILAAIVAAAIPTYAADTAKALTVVFRNEGGLSMDPNDSGNWSGGKVGVGTLLGTKYGIAGSVYGPYFLKHGKKIKDINLTDAAKIYERDYGAPLQPAKIKSQGVYTMALDTDINCGSGTAARLLAKTINVLNGRSEDFPVNSALKQTEIDWINWYTQTRVFEGQKDRTKRQLFKAVFREMRARHYVAICRAKPQKLRYLPTWLERTYE